MQLESLVVSAAAGFLATYVHMACALWGPCYGGARLDFAKALAATAFGETFDGKPPYALGLMALHLNGIFFALLYATVVGPLLPETTGLVRGLLYGGILWVGAQLVFVPFVLKDGFFGVKGPPRAWLTAIVVHAVYGIIVAWLSPLAPMVPVS